MKHILSIAFLLCVASISAQVIRGDKIIVKTGGEMNVPSGAVLKLAGYSVTGISNDSTAGSSSSVKLITEAAAKGFANTKDPSTTNELAIFTAAGTAPGSPKLGDFWWKNTTDSVFIRTSVPSWAFFAIRAGGSGSTTLASNGLTMDGDTVQLGGTPLNENTTINIANKNYNVSGDNVIINIEPDANQPLKLDYIYQGNNYSTTSLAPSSTGTELHVEAGTTVSKYGKLTISGNNNQTPEVELFTRNASTNKGVFIDSTGTYITVSGSTKYPLATTMPSTTAGDTSIQVVAGNPSTAVWMDIDDIGGSGAAQKFDILETGQSNAVVRDLTVGTWTYEIDSSIYAITNAGAEVIFNPTALNWQTGETGGSADSIRNNIAWQAAKQIRAYDKNTTVRIVSHATGSRASWYWTPKTSGQGEGGASNALLDGVIARLNSAPADYNARMIIFPQGENDDSDGFMRFWLNNLTEIYDTLTSHSKVADDAIFLISYPDCDNATFDSLRNSIDSLINHTRDVGNRNILGVKFCLNGFDNIHFTNEQVTEIGRYYYSNYVEGYANNAGQTASTGWRVVGSTVQLDNTSNNVSIANDVSIDEASGGNYGLTVIRRDDTEMARFRRLTGAGSETHSLELISGTADSGSGFWVDYKNAGTHNNMMRFYPGGLDFEDASYANVFSINFPSKLSTFTGRIQADSISATNFLPITINRTDATLYNIGKINVHRMSLLAGSDTTSTGGLIDQYQVYRSGAYSTRNALRRHRAGWDFENQSFADVMVINTSLNSVGIGISAPVASALLDLTSTTKGFLTPRMTTTQRNAISSPANGLQIYSTSLNKPYFYNSSAWVAYVDSLTNAIDFRSGVNTITTNTTFNGTFDWRMGNTTTLDTIQNKAATILLEGATNGVQAVSNFQVNKRLLGKKGADVASAADLTLGDGNYFYVTGTTNVTAITTTGWQAGSEVTLRFQGGLDVINNTAGGGSTAPIFLQGGSNFTVTQFDILKLMFDGSAWYEVSRSVN